MLSGLISGLMSSTFIFEASASCGFGQGGSGASFLSSSAVRSRGTSFNMAAELVFFKVLRSQGYWPKFSSMHRAFLCTRRILLRNCACRDPVEGLSHFLVMRPITFSVLHSVCVCLAPFLFGPPASHTHS